jgi:hypothetical protein
MEVGRRQIGNGNMEQRDKGIIARRVVLSAEAGVDRMSTGCQREC